MGKSLADAFDSYVNWIVFFLFLTALNFGLEASTYLVNATVSEELQDWARWAARGGNITLALAMISWVRILSRKRRHQGRRTFLDEFAMETIKRSASVTFLVTICLVAILDIVTNTTQLSADFFIKLLGLSLSGGFSVSFFAFNYFSRTYPSEEEQSK